MKNLFLILAVFSMAAAIDLIAPVPAIANSFQPLPVRADQTDLQDFDFLTGEWHVRHRRLKPGSHEWIEFDGTCSNRKFTNGWANLEEHVLNSPTGPYRAIALRSYDPKSQQWSIWWLDSRYPSGPLDPPVRGRFEKGVGTFYSDQPLNGKPARVRFIWSQITSNSARWEQAFSSDGGKTWETNWS